MGGPRARITHIGGTRALISTVGGIRAPITPIGGTRALILTVGGIRAPITPIGGTRALISTVGGIRAPIKTTTIGGTRAPIGGRECEISQHLSIGQLCCQSWGMLLTNLTRLLTRDAQIAGVPR